MITVVWNRNHRLFFRSISFHTQFYFICAIAQNLTFYRLIKKLEIKASGHHLYWDDAIEISFLCLPDSRFHNMGFKIIFILQSELSQWHTLPCLQSAVKSAFPYIRKAQR